MPDARAPCAAKNPAQDPHHVSPPLHNLDRGCRLPPCGRRMVKSKARRVASVVLFEPPNPPALRTGRLPVLTKAHPDRVQQSRPPSSDCAPLRYPSRDAITHTPKRWCQPRLLRPATPRQHQKRPAMTTCRTYLRTTRSTALKRASHIRTAQCYPDFSWIPPLRPQCGGHASRLGRCACRRTPRHDLAARGRHRGAHRPHRQESYARRFTRTCKAIPQGGV